MVDKNLPWLAREGGRNASRPVPYPGGRRTCARIGSTAGAGFPVGSRVSKATGVEAADDADSSGRRGSDCVRRSAAASALQDWPKFFEKVPDNVVLHSEVRERLVRLLAKRQ